PMRGRPRSFGNKNAPIAVCRAWDCPMSDDETWRRFEAVALPHLDAAYNLARWLTRNDHDAEDVVQEALVRAMRYLGGFRGEGARAWLLQIVRNTCWTWMKENRPAEHVALGDDDGEAQ